MKKILLLFLFFLSCFLSNYAQNLEPKRYTNLSHDSIPVKKYSAMGVHVGLNPAIMAQNIINVSDPGFVFDVYEIFAFNDKWLMQFGLGGIKYGGKNLGYGNKNLRNDTLFYFNYNFTGMFYVTVPILIKYQYSPKSTFTAGVRLSSLINPYGNSIDGYEVKGIKYEYPALPTNDGLPPASNTKDISVLAGYEYHFNRKFSIGAIINIGFVPILTKAYTDQNGTIYPIGAGNYNSSISIGLSYDFLGTGGK